MVHHMEGKEIGILSLIYDPTKPDISNHLLRIQHESLNITSAMHVHLSEDECVEVSILHGDAKSFNAITERLMKIKGISNVKMTTIKKKEED
jgi:CopG family nickel-responsive transcriptional regulator